MEEGSCWSRLEGDPQYVGEVRVHRHRHRQRHTVWACVAGRPRCAQATQGRQAASQLSSAGHGGQAHQIVAAGAVQGAVDHVQQAGALAQLQAQRAATL